MWRAVGVEEDGDSQGDFGWLVFGCVVGVVLIVVVVVVLARVDLVVKSTSRGIG